MDIEKIESMEELGKFQTEVTEVEEVEVNLIRFADRSEDLFDVRRWKTSANGHKEPLEGISLTVTEFEELQEVLDSIKIGRPVSITKYI